MGHIHDHHKPQYLINPRILIFLSKIQKHILYVSIYEKKN